jgi:hypothetical protein
MRTSETRTTRDSSSRRRALHNPIRRVLPSAPGDRLFWGSALSAIAIHAILLFGPGELRGGADLRPHLRLIQLMTESPALRNVYAPAYHVLGDLLTPLVGLAAYPRWFGLASAVALIAGFRCFQRAAGLPAACSALFAWTPYAFALSWCLPKIEAAGYALAFAGLALALRNRRLALAAALAATFAVHTAAALFLGLCGGALALVRRDPRLLAALAAGCTAASPLFAVHLAAGCNAAQALLFSQGDYLRSGARQLASVELLRVVALAGPLAVALALAGSAELWRRWRPVALIAALVTVLYLNELWLAPLGARTTLDLMRGLTLLAFPVAAAAGVWLGERPRAAVAAVVACALWAAGTSWFVVPGSCYVRTVALEEIEHLEVDRCTFRWRERQSVR